jgi:calcineurin-like phosphoesterase family protein
MDYFTSDWHIGHERLCLVYCNRPFATIRKHDKAIPKRAKEVLTPDDTLYMLGDLTLAGPDYLNLFIKLIQQNIPASKKVLVLGNHDRMWWYHYIQMGFDAVHSELYLPEYDIYLTHDPKNAIKDMSKIWLCGHVHQHWKHTSNTINVGVDVWDFKPVSIEQLKDIHSLVIR